MPNVMVMTFKTAVQVGNEYLLLQNPELQRSLCNHQSSAISQAFAFLDHRKPRAGTDVQKCVWESQLEFLSNFPQLPLAGVMLGIDFGIAWAQC